ncbi:coiled-coil domain-containing protein 97 [Anthonomus grandis grandis]|uniref:coiled-coil domain-containing protein 97 n=1 Tax=Anthonomus grandis grandis TaxID=2921223 RepID=UPI0021651AE7|nr:coiled-coil domain-containing protein 97 [Anthonomus grandis grandis]
MDQSESLTTDCNMTVSSEIDNIIRTLVANPDVIFKSQQRGEAEPNDLEKTEIAQQLFDKNKTSFLIKFGKYLDMNQLGFFDKFMEGQFDPEGAEEVRIILNSLKADSVRNKRNVLVKNRRYEALQQMIKDDSYFSEIEMMKRNPLLYEQLVGQYLTDEEKRDRDKYEMIEGVTFVKILMEGIERDKAELSRKLQQQKEDSQMEESDSSDEDRPVEEISVSLKSARPSTSRWGEFEEESIQATRSKKSAPMVTGSERLLLKQEFVSTMYQNFIDGKDNDFFDYNTVDNNPSYDNISEMDLDAEEKYFDSEDPEDVINRGETRESSEDELDIYMNALNQHPAICELAENINERL